MDDGYSPQFDSSYWDAVNSPQQSVALPQMRTNANNAAIAAAFAKRKAAQSSAGRPVDRGVNRSQSPQQSVSGSLNDMMVGGYASAGPRLDAAVGGIGKTLNANADRMNKAAMADAQEQGKTRRLSMLMGMMAPMLGGGGGGSSGGFMTNFGQMALPGSFLGMGGGGGGGAYGGVPMADGKPDYQSADIHNSFMRQNMLKTLAGLRGVMGTDPSKLAGGGNNPTFGQMFGSY